MPSSIHVAYIHEAADPAAGAFKALLDANGFATDLIDVSAITQAPYSPFRQYAALIVASDSGEWERNAAVEAVRYAERPVLFLGRSGTSALQRMGSPLGDVMGASQKSIRVMDPSLAIFSRPYALTVPENRILFLYRDTHVDNWGAYLWGTPPPGVLRIGSFPVDFDHYPLAREGQRMLWGFEQGPDEMTETGRRLFVNVVAWLTDGTRWFLPIVRK